MRFSWASGKAAQNRLQHGDDFADAVFALEDYIRIISARKADASEIKQYFHGISQ